MKKVLIVDDEKSFLSSLKDGLSVHQTKFQVLTAENGQEAVSILQTLPIDLLITDLKMPKMDGFELLAWVSREQCELPVIVMTAFGTAEIEDRLARMDTLQYLEKPLDFKMLQDSIFSGLKAGTKSYIHGITLATFLQLTRVDQKNCTMKVTSGDKVGYLYIRQGELVDAEFSELSGDTAALEIVAWEDTEIEMNNICRRQKTVISLPMEHLLMEAFQRKDEQADQEKPVPSGVPAGNNTRAVKAQMSNQSGIKQTVKKQDLTPYKSIRNQLLIKMKTKTGIVEFVIFDHQGFFKEKNPGKCSIESFDPSLFTHLIDQFDQFLSFGSCNFLSFNTDSRYRYLLFNYREHRVLLKVTSEIKPQLLVREIKSHVNH